MAHSRQGPVHSTLFFSPNTTLPHQLHLALRTLPNLCPNITGYAHPPMYNLDGNPAQSDHTLFKDLLKMTTSKWQSMLKKDPSPAQTDTNTRPCVSRSSTQLSMPKSKE